MSQSNAFRRNWVPGLLWGLVIAIFLAPITVNIYEHLAHRHRALPDEKSAILQLLAQKFAGDSYFQADAQDAAASLSAAKVYLGVTEARNQMPRIVAARHLSADEAAQLSKIIDRMTEPSSSRIVGEERVNLLLLNLALDAQK